MIKVTKDDIGKRIVFKSPTRWANIKATGMIKDVAKNGYVIVRYGGCADFYVKPSEVIEVLNREGRVIK